MTVSSDNSENAPATVYALGLDAQAAVPILDAVDATGVGFRQYSSVESLLESVGPSVTGCILLRSASGSSGIVGTIDRLTAYFHSLPIVIFLGSDSAANAVECMQHGVFSVLPPPIDHEKLLSTITSAIELSESSQATIDHARIASLRMNQATAKELEVLDLIMAGLKNREISEQLGITVRAVEDRRFRLMKKVGVDSVAELLVLAVTAKYHGQNPSPGIRNVPAAGPKQSVKGIEVWVPTADQRSLQLNQSCYRDALAFQEASQGVTFRRGEGLPGKIWETRSPAFLRELITTEFVRSAAAGAVGMTTAVGFPVFNQGKISAVVLFLLDSRHQMKAVFESWKPDAESGAMRLAGGCYINSESLRRLSEFVHLPPGEGLPGFVSQQARPYVTGRFRKTRMRYEVLR